MPFSSPPVYLLKLLYIFNMYGITGEYTDLCSAHNIITVLDGQALAETKQILIRLDSDKRER